MSAALSETKTITRVCLRCGNSFADRIKHGRPGFCGEACRIEVIREQKRNWARTKARRAGKQRLCATCSRILPGRTIGLFCVDHRPKPSLMLRMPRLLPSPPLAPSAARKEEAAAKSTTHLDTEAMTAAASANPCNKRCAVCGNAFYDQTHRCNRKFCTDGGCTRNADCAPEIVLNSRSIYRGRVLPMLGAE